MSAGSTRQQLSVLTVGLLLGSSTFSVLAHRPLLSRASCGADFGSPSSALRIPDPTISWSFSHYADCNSRALWLSFENPVADSVFYVGVGVPVQERFADLRADALIIGPGLPQLTDEQRALLPGSVRDELDGIAGGGSNVGALLFRSPQDQSSCSHLGPTMQQSSTVKNGRCDFYEPFGQTNSWRVLDADGNKMPAAGETYHVAVWLQEHTSGKFGVAVGTWVENFALGFPGYPAQPSCTTENLMDFSEQRSSVDPNCFPVVECGSAEVANNCDEPATGKSGNAGGDSECPGGATTLTDSDAKYTMVCGGKRCPAAAALWEDVNMKMHSGMAIRFSKYPDVDFVRGMIPHHNGAVHMCDVLLNELTCEKYENVGALDGLVHFCNHVKREQELQVAGMESWLRAKLETLDDEAVRVGTCDSMMHARRDEEETHDMEGDHAMAGDHAMESGEEHGAQSMSMGCGETALPASKAFIHANRQMHASMSVAVSCEHTIDFVRAMIPHHKGAILMCDVLLDAESWMPHEGHAEEHAGEDEHAHEHRRAQSMAGPDSYLQELCTNITRLQRAEVVFLERWLVARGYAVHAPCGLDAAGLCPTTGLQPFAHLQGSGGGGEGGEGAGPALACEDTLPTSSFCHLPNGAVNDDFCTCEALLAEGVHTCAGPPLPVSEGSSQVLDMQRECERLCGGCAERHPLFELPCAGCQADGSYPYFCSSDVAALWSPVGTAHQDGGSGAGACLWMPDGASAMHGGYAGDAPECKCSGHGPSCVGADGDEESGGALRQGSAGLRLMVVMMVVAASMLVMPPSR